MSGTTDPWKPFHDLAAKWDATAARNQRNGQSLLDQGDEYGSEGLAVAEALGDCVVHLRALLADYETATPAAPQPAPELQAGEIVYLYHWRFDRGEEFGLYRHAADADAKAAQHADEGLSEVLSMAVLGRPEQPAPELAAAMAVIAEYERLADGLVIPNRAFRAAIREHAGMPS